jgi:hypothetical protein
MAEQRREAEVLLAEERAPLLVVRACPLRPRVEPHRKGRRAERQQVHEHGLVVASPVVFQEPLFRRPAEADRGRLRLCPPPVYTPVDRVHERPDLDFLRIRAVEVRLAEQRPGDQDRGVDRRELAVLEALARLHVQEVIEEPAVPGHSARLRPLRGRGEEAQRRDHAASRLLARDVAALDADGIGGEAEAHGGDARVRRRGVPVGDQSVLGIGGVPEEPEGSLLEIHQDAVDFRARRHRHHVRQLDLLGVRGGTGGKAHADQHDGRDQSDLEGRALSGHRHLPNGRRRRDRSRAPVWRPTAAIGRDDVPGPGPGRNRPLDRFMTRVFIPRVMTKVFHSDCCFASFMPRPSRAEVLDSSRLRQATPTSPGRSSRVRESHLPQHARARPTRRVGYGRVVGRHGLGNDAAHPGGRRGNPRRAAVRLVAGGSAAHAQCTDESRSCLASVGRLDRGADDARSDVRGAARTCLAVTVP